MNERFEHLNKWYNFGFMDAANGKEKDYSSAEVSGEMNAYLLGYTEGKRWRKDFKEASLEDL